MKKLLSLLCIALFLITLSCEDDKESKPKCSLTFQGEKYSTDVSVCYDNVDGFYAGSISDGKEWNVVVDPVNEDIFFSIEITNGTLEYADVANLSITISENTYTFSADMEEIDTQEEAQISGVCTCDDL